MKKIYRNTMTTICGGGGKKRAAAASADDGKTHEENAKDFGLMAANVTIGLIAATLVFVASLAWNSAAQEELKRAHKFGSWVYAAVVTVFVILLGALLAWIKTSFLDKAVQEKDGYHHDCFCRRNNNSDTGGLAAFSI